MFLTSALSQRLDISNDAMLASEKGYNRLVEALKTLETITPKKTSTVNIDELERNYTLQWMMISYTHNIDRTIYLMQ